MRWLILLLAVGALSACNCSSTTCGLTPGGGAGGAGGGVAANVLVVLAGGPVSLDLSTSPRFNTCDNSQVNASRVDLEVLDPHNLRVDDATATTPATGNDGFVHSTVTFTPALPGAYHVTARFEPDLGIVQKDLTAALDKRSTGTTVPLDENCVAVGFDADTVLCLDPPYLFTLRGGVTVTSTSATTFDLSGDKVWTSQPGLVQVYGLGSDGSLQPLGSLSLALPDAPRLLAQDTRALLLADAQTQEAKLLPDGGFSLGSPLALQLDGPHAQWVPDVGLQVTGTTAAAHCAFAQSLGAFSGGCETSQVIDLGADDDAVWFYDPANTSFNTYPVQAAGWRTGEASAAAGALDFVTEQPPGASPSPVARSAPFLYTGGPEGAPSQLYLPRFTPDGVILEQYTFVDPTSAHGADSKHVWMMVGSTLTWWPR